MKEISDNIKVVLKEINYFLNEVVFKRAFYLPLAIILTISYGFSIFNRTVSVDDMGQELYYGSGLEKIKGLRWGQWLTDRLLSTVKYTPFLNRFLGVLFLALTAILLCVLFTKLSGKQQPLWIYTTFSCLFVSYPLINEFFEYFEALTIPFMFAIAVFCILYQYLNRFSLKNVVFVGLLMSIIMAGYESLIFVYITLTFIVLFYKHVLKDNNGGWLKEGFGYALPLFIALILKFAVGYLSLFILNVSHTTDGDVGITWLTKGFGTALTQLVFNGWYYLIRGLSYLPIGIFDITYLVFFIYIIRKQVQGRKYSLIIGLLLMISVFFLPIMQGSNYGYRMAQTVHLFTDFVILLLLTEVNYKETTKKIIIVLLLFLSFRQAVNLHYILALNNQRSDNEAALISNIGFKLYSEHDLSKEVVFVGSIDLGDYIDSDIYVDDDSLAGKLENYLRTKFGYDGEEYNIPIVSTDVGSEINWMISSNWQKVIKNYLSYYGYDIRIDEDLTAEEQDKLYKLAKEKNLKPYEIMETDGYIVVYMGN